MTACKQLKKIRTDVLKMSIREAAELCGYANGAGWQPYEDETRYPDHLPYKFITRIKPHLITFGISDIEIDSLAGINRGFGESGGSEFAVGGKRPQTPVIDIHTLPTEPISEITDQASKDAAALFNLGQITRDEVTAVELSLSSAMLDKALDKKDEFWLTRDEMKVAIEKAKETVKALQR